MAGLNISLANAHPSCTRLIWQYLTPPVPFALPHTSHLPLPPASYITPPLPPASYITPPPCLEHNTSPSPLRHVSHLPLPPASYITPPPCLVHHTSSLPLPHTSHLPLPPASCITPPPPPCLVHHSSSLPPQSPLEHDGENKIKTEYAKLHDEMVEAFRKLEEN